MAKKASAHAWADIPWDDVRLFLAVAEAGSVSGAARLLRLGQPTVSRRLAELERRLGFVLFLRQPSGVRPTPAGERLLDPARRMAEWAGELGRAAARGEGRPEGLVRIAAPPGVAVELVAPFAGWLKGKHPGITVEALSSVQYLDLARGEADLALRLRPPSSADLALVATLEHANAAFVSKAYAAKLPKRPRFEDVAWIAWAPPFQDLPPNRELEALIPGFRPSFTSDNYLVQLAAAEAGLGAMVLGDVRHRFSRRTLVPLPIDLGPHARSKLYLVCARSALAIPRIRLVADLLATELAAAR